VYSLIVVAELVAALFQLTVVYCAFLGDVFDWEVESTVAAVVVVVVAV
jgi:hypothetical protein